MSQLKTILTEKTKAARALLVEELRGIVDRILLEAAFSGDDSPIIGFTNNCTRYGGIEGSIVKTVIGDLKSKGLDCTCYEKVRYAYGNIIYTIHSDGTYTSAPVRSKEYVDTINIDW
jgi:hypothetical protein